SPRHLDLAHQLGGPHVGQLAGHGRDVVGLGRDRRVLRIRQRLAELLVAAVQVADDRVHARYRLALEREDGAKDAVGGRVLRPHVHGEALASAVAQLDDFSRFRVHSWFSAWGRTRPGGGRWPACWRAVAWPWRGRSATPAPGPSWPGRPRDRSGRGRPTC